MAVREELIEIAREAIPIAVNQWISTHVRSLLGEIDVTAKDIAHCDLPSLLAKVAASTSEETHRIQRHLEPATIGQQTTDRWNELVAALDTQDDWKKVFPGKLLFARFASVCQLKTGFLRSAYTAAARRVGLAPFSDITAIFDGWSH